MKTPSRSITGFTLIELLTVVTIIMIMMGLAVPFLGGIVRPNRFNKGVHQISTLLDQAREYAVSQNTYVWVAFHESPSSGSQTENRIAVAVIASKDGTNSLGWSGTPTVPNADLDLISKPEWVESVQLESNQVLASLSLSNTPAENGEQLAGSLTFNVSAGGGQSLNFNQVILYTPRGEAITSDSPVAYTDLVLQPMRSTRSDDHNVAIIQVNGLTGISRVYRQ